MTSPMYAMLVVASMALSMSYYLVTGVLAQGAVDQANDGPGFSSVTNIKAAPAAGQEFVTSGTSVVAVDLNLETMNAHGDAAVTVRITNDRWGDSFGAARDTGLGFCIWLVGECGKDISGLSGPFDWGTSVSKARYASSC